MEGYKCAPVHTEQGAHHDKSHWMGGSLNRKGLRLKGWAMFIPWETLGNFWDIQVTYHCLKSVRFGEKCSSTVLTFVLLSHIKKW